MNLSTSIRDEELKTSSYSENLSVLFAISYPKMSYACCQVGHSQGCIEYNSQNLAKSRGFLQGHKRCAFDVRFAPDIIDNAS